MKPTAPSSPSDVENVEMVAAVTFHCQNLSMCNISGHASSGDGRVENNADKPCGNGSVWCFSFSTFDIFLFFFPGCQHLEGASAELIPPSIQLWKSTKPPPIDKAARRRQRALSNYDELRPLLKAPTATCGGGKAASRKTGARLGKKLAA